MEHTANAVVVPLDAGWSDVGSWDMVWEVSQKNENANVMNNKTFCKDASGNMIHTSDGRPVVVLGIKNCIIIESESGLLITNFKSLYIYLSLFILICRECRVSIFLGGSR
jgi:mannose-1-phosphate guanylyltransferase